MALLIPNYMETAFVTALEQFHQNPARFEEFIQDYFSQGFDLDKFTNQFLVQFQVLQLDEQKAVQKLAGNTYMLCNRNIRQLKDELNYLLENLCREERLICIDGIYTLTNVVNQQNATSTTLIAQLIQGTIFENENIPSSIDILNPIDITKTKINKKSLWISPKDYNRCRECVNKDGSYEIYLVAMNMLAIRMLDGHTSFIAPDFCQQVTDSALIKPSVLNDNEPIHLYNNPIQSDYIHFSKLSKCYSNKFKNIVSRLILKKLITQNDDKTFSFITTDLTVINNSLVTQLHEYRPNKSGAIRNKKLKNELSAPASKISETESNNPIDDIKTEIQDDNDNITGTIEAKETRTIEAKEVEEMWKKFLIELRQFEKNISDSNFFSTEEKTLLQSAYKEANQLNHSTPPSVYKYQQKDAEGAPTGFPFPDKKKSLSRLFREKVLPNDMPLGFMGFLSTQPITVGPLKNNQYLFERYPEYNDVKKRKELLERYYQLPQQHGDYETAAKFLLIIFQHIFKMYLTLGRSNTSGYKIYINAQLFKLGLERMEKRTIYTLTQLTSKHFRHAEKTHAFNAQTQDETVDLSPILKKPSLALHSKGTLPKNIEAMVEENNVIKIWVRRHDSNEKLNKKIDELSPHDILVSQNENSNLLTISAANVEVYDAETGKLQIAYSRNALNSEDIDALRADVVRIKRTHVVNCGNGRADEGNSKTKHIEEEEYKEEDESLLGLSVVLGFSSSKHKHGAGFTSFTMRDPLHTDALIKIGKVLSKAEEYYQHLAPEEYAYVKNNMNQYADFVIPYSHLYTSIDINFDKQTKSHLDNNKFPGCVLRPLFVVYPNGKKEYEGAYTYFLPYNLAIDLQEGDLLFADFDRNIHCNTKMITQNNSNLSLMDTKYRFSFVPFSKKYTLDHLSRFFVEDSSENTDLIVTQDNKITRRKPVQLMEIETTMNLENPNNNNSQPLSDEQKDIPSVSPKGHTLFCEVKPNTMHKSILAAKERMSSKDVEEKSSKKRSFKDTEDHHLSDDGYSSDGSNEINESNKELNIKKDKRQG